MNEFLKVLLNIRSLRAAMRDLPFEQLEEIKEKMDSVIAERLAATAAEHEKRLEREKKLAEFRELLAQEGISPHDLVGSSVAAAPSTKSQRAPRPPKYQYEHQGQVKTWTGQGRMPAPIASAVNAGQALEDFLIPA